jgi:hypothetical protein
MADKTCKTRLELLREFEAAPPSALFTQSTIAALLFHGEHQTRLLARQGRSI